MKVNIKKMVRLYIDLGRWLVQNLLTHQESFSHFLKNATDEELAVAREKVRLDYCNPKLDDSYRGSLQGVLTAFDREMQKRKWGNEKPHAPSIHREHGWYLPNDD